MNRAEFIESLRETYDRCLAIVAKKNADYANSEDPFLNFRNSEAVGVPTERGIMVRMSDKFTRISNLLDKEPDVVDEAIEDSIEDLINYAAILLAYIQESTKKK